MVELQLCQLQETETGKGRRWGAAIFGGEEGEEVRQLHGAKGELHSEERCGNWGG
jgi:hypothetical protein